MKTIKAMTIVAVFLFLCSSCILPVFQTTTPDDFEGGVNAYNAGDYNTALLIFSRLADLGDSRAQNYLGEMYSFGHGVPQNSNKSIQWYIKAYELGDNRAPFQIGRLYESGKGVSQNYRLAAKWYEKAAQLGNTVAPYRLGIMYAMGRGVKQDNIRAYAWLVIATSTDNSEAESLRHGLSTKMSTSDINKAYELSPTLFDSENRKDF